MTLTMITGGARSGKSTFAEKKVKGYVDQLEKQGQPNNVLYIATAIPFDDEMKDRIKKHQEQRPDHWRTVEKFRGLGQIIDEAEERIILLDCMTLLVSNLVLESNLDEDNPEMDNIQAVEEMITREVEGIIRSLRDDQQMVIVTNELGMGMVPPYPLGRIFRDIAGRINQKVAAASDKVYLVISGIPTLIKGGE